jgi:hypothetical protein
MEAYLKRHEAFVRRQLAQAGEAVDWAGLADSPHADRLCSTSASSTSS